MTRGPRCISCGCTEDRACPMKLGGSIQGCSWVVVDRRRGEGLCSACATTGQVLYAVLARAGKRTPRGGWTTEELAGYLHLAHYTVTGVLQKLSRKKLITRDGPAWTIAP